MTKSLDFFIATKCNVMFGANIISNSLVAGVRRGHPEGDEG